MASQVLHLLPFFFLVFALSTSVRCSGPLHSNISGFAANDHLEMVIKAPARPPPPSPRPPDPPQPRAFTHYIFALQWPLSICQSKWCKSGFKPPKYFTIHGLWPSTNTVHVQNCTNEKFKWGDVMGLQKKFDTFWPTLFGTVTQQAFLGMEWAKHGTCSGLTQIDYFTTIFNLLEKANALQKLNHIGFGPDPKKTYNPSKIVEAYMKEYNYSIRIICVTKRESSDEMFGEIYHRVNKETKELESLTTRSRCNTNDVYFPSEMPRPPPHPRSMSLELDSEV